MLARHHVLQRACSTRLATIVAALFAPIVTVAFPPHADVPLEPELFSIDMASPTVTPGGISEADILIKPGPFPIVPSFAIGITPLDELDGISADEGEFLPGDPFVFIFSVGRGSVGGIAPDAGLVALNRPFNVMDQAARNQAVGDLFMTTIEFNGMPQPFGGPHGPFVPNNTLVKNQGDAGGVDMDLKNLKAPIQTDDPAALKDAVDSVAGAKSNSSGAASFAPFKAGAPRGPGGPGTDPFDIGPIFFTLRRGSPSLQTLPGGQIPSGANIYFDPNPFEGGNEQLFLPADALGLGDAPIQNDISGLTVFTGDPTRGVGGPVVLFSLAPGSPALGAAFSPADIFISTGGGTFALFASAAELGLSPITDAVNGFTILKTTNVDQLVLDSAIQLFIPGDYNEDGALTEVDCEAFEDCYSGSGLSFDDNGPATFDIEVGPGAAFNPSAVTIQVGDTVRWTWIDGPHNVVSGPIGAPDGAFFSGPPIDVVGHEFTVTFDSFFLNAFPKQSYPYFSEPDASTGLTGEILVEAHPCATFDMDFDGDTDCDDWLGFRALHIQLNGHVCVPLTIEEFVAALLCQPLHPAHTCFADVNGDGTANGRDIRPFVVNYLAGP